MSLSIQSGLLTPGILVPVTAAEQALFISPNYPDSKNERYQVPAGGQYPVPQTSGQGPYNYVPGFIPLNGSIGVVGSTALVRADVDSLSLSAGGTVSAASDFNVATSATMAAGTGTNVGNISGVIGSPLAAAQAITSTAATFTVANVVGLSLNSSAVTSGLAKYTKVQVITERCTPNANLVAGVNFPTTVRQAPLNTEADLVCDLVILSAAGVLKDVIKPYIYRNMENMADRGANRFAGMYEFLYPLHNAAGAAGALSPLVATDVLAVRLSHPINPRSGIVPPVGFFRVYLNAISN